MEEDIVINGTSISDISIKLYGNTGGNSWTKAKNLCIKYGKTFEKKVKKEREYINCLICGKELTEGQMKFCSNSCSAKYHNKTRCMTDDMRKNISLSLKKYYQKNKNYEYDENFNLIKQLIFKEKKYCIVCGDELVKHQKKYCSNHCLVKKQKIDIIEEWRRGKYIINSNNSLTKSIKKYLLEKCNYKCQVCGFEGCNKKTFNTILQVHHIDGDSSNNKEENIQIICPNCHAMTENYMGLNKGKSARNKRYKNK